MTKIKFTAISDFDTKLKDFNHSYPQNVRQDAAAAKQIKRIAAKNLFNSINDNVNGVYVVGVKMDSKFCPLYVGISNDIKKRMLQHWVCNLRDGYLNSHKELFDFSFGIPSLYKSIEIWNEEWHLKKHTKKQKEILYKKLDKRMIWFNDNLFFDNYLSLQQNHESSKYRDNLDWHCGSLNYDLPNLKNGGTQLNIKEIDNLILKIESTKNYITNNFYFGYYENSPARIENLKDFEHLQKIEAELKYELQQKHIFTYASVIQNPMGKQIWDGLINSNDREFVFDFTNLNLIELE